MRSNFAADLLANLEDASALHVDGHLAEHCSAGEAVPAVAGVERVGSRDVGRHEVPPRDTGPLLRARERIFGWAVFQRFRIELLHAARLRDRVADIVDNRQRVDDRVEADDVVFHGRVADGRRAGVVLDPDSARRAPRTRRAVPASSGEVGDELRVKESHCECVVVDDFVEHVGLVDAQARFEAEVVLDQPAYIDNVARRER